MYDSTITKLSDAFITAGQEAAEVSLAGTAERNYDQANGAEGEIYALREAMNMILLAVEIPAVHNSPLAGAVVALDESYDKAYDALEIFRDWLDESPVVPTSEVSDAVAAAITNAPVRVRRCLAKQAEPTTLSQDKADERRNASVKILKEHLPETYQIIHLRYRTPKIIVWDKDAVRVRI